MFFETCASKLHQIKTRAFVGSTGAMFRGMTMLTIGTITAKVIGFVAIPILSRLYNPEDFGVLAIFASLISILVPFVTFRYPLAIPLPRHDGMAINILILSVGLMVCMILIFGAVLGIFGSSLLGLFSAEKLAPYWWLVVLGLIGGASYEIISFWATRKRAYKIVAQTIALQGLLGNLIKIGFGFLAVKPLGLLVGHLLATSGGITSLYLSLKSDFLVNSRHIRWQRIKLAAGRYRDFPTYRLPSQIFLVLAQQMPIMLMAYAFGAAALGQFALAKMVVSLPVHLLSDALGKSAYGELAKIGRKNPTEIKKILNSTIKGLFLAALFPVVGIFLLSPYVLPFILGKEWNDAGLYASGLSIYLLATVIAVPMPAFVNVFERQKEFLVWNAIRCIILGLLFGCVIAFEVSALVFVFCYGVTMLVYQFGVVVRTYNIVSVEQEKASLEINKYGR